MTQENWKEAFYSDMVSLILIVLVIGVLVLLVSLSLLENQVNAGLWLTGSVSILVFYCLRGRFRFWPTLLQIVAVSLLTAGEICLVDLMLSKVLLIKGSIVVIFFIIFFLTMFCINKQIMDHVFEKLGMKVRTSKSINMV